MSDQLYNEVMKQLDDLHDHAHDLDNMLSKLIVLVDELKVEVLKRDQS